MRAWKLVSMLCLWACILLWLSNFCSVELVLVATASATPPQAMAGQEELQTELVRANSGLAAQRDIINSDVYQAQQRLWFDQRRKRGPPATPLASPLDTAGGTPQEDTVMEGEGSQEAKSTPQLFQPVPVSEQVAFQMTAAQAGCDMNNAAEVQNYMDTPVQTRGDVLRTLREYHIGVLRPELYHFVTQMESVVAKIDDRLTHTQENLHWLSSECRAQQKRESGLLVITSGWDPNMAPNDRLYMINWLLGQCEPIRQFLMQRTYNASDSCKYWYLGVLTQDPATPPAGQKWSTVTTLQFKSWDMRKEFMSLYGGGSGTPLYKSDTEPVPKFHIRCTPASPQFQRKLELPIRVLLAAHTKYAELQATPPEPIVILWRTLTLMKPSESREFDPQAIAWARVTYFEEEGTFQGILEIHPDFKKILTSKPPADAEESSLWDFCWNSTAFGVQHELDEAEKLLFSKARSEAKGGQKGMKLGKGKLHWSSPFVYSSASDPFPIPLQIKVVEAVAYSWDEYADKCNMASVKVGSYTQATYQGAPGTPGSAATPPGVKTEQNLSKAAPSSAPGLTGKAKGRGRG